MGKPNNTDEKIYNVLDKAERLAIKLAKINRLINKGRKKTKKKEKKLCKVNKKTGALMLKKEKKQKVAKHMKRQQ